MLRLTKKADYGLMALKFLAEHPNQTSLRARYIAEAYHIPPQFLAKILQRIAKVGILRSHAGMSGGYSLLKNPREISAFEVIHAIDGPLFITSCGTSHDGCELTDSCTIREPLARVNDSISGLLRSISIADLAEPTAEKAQELISIRM